MGSQLKSDTKTSTNHAAESGRNDFIQCKSPNVLSVVTLLLRAHVHAGARESFGCQV